MIEYITTEHIEEARKKNLLRFGPIGEQVYKRTYSRKKVDGTQEDWYETAARVVNGNCNYVSSNFIEKDEPQKLFEQICKMELMPAGRHLWATNIGNKTAYTNNCYSASMTGNFTDHFEFTFMRLMEGGGVGANYSNLFIHSRNGTPATQGKPWVPKAPKNIHIVCDSDHRDYHSLIELASNEDKDFPECIWLSEEQKNDYASFRSWKGETSKVQTYGKDLVTGEELSWKVLPPFVQFQSLLSKTYSPDWDPRVSNGEGPLYIRVEDSREGWTKALAIVLNSYINDEDVRDIVIDVSLVRPFGEALKGFGGKASGPEALMLMLHRMSILLNQRVGQPLKTLDYMLLDHYIAMAVVSGGVRRSARMAMKYWKDEDVFDFITCKNTKPGEVPAHWTTNISIVVDNNFLRALKRKDPHAVKVYEQVCTSMASGNGEPGFVNASKQLEGEVPGTKFVTTNPCTTQDTWVMTTEGPKQVKDLLNKIFSALVNGKAYFCPTGFFSTGTKEVFLLKTAKGNSVKLTKDHPVYVKKDSGFEWVELQNLTPGDLVVLHNHTAQDGDFTSAVQSIEPAGVEEVYDCQVEEVHAFDANGLYVHNCGEITMVQYEDMYCFDVCCLGHINLDRVQNPDESFRLMTRFLIRATFGPVADPRQKENVERNRRIGVGIMGYHSWLCKNSIKYSDAPRNEEIRVFFRKQKKIVDDAAAEYASQLRIPVPIKRTTCAPTGTISNLAGCTGSMQSLFSKFLIRRVQYSNSDQTLKDTRALGTYKIEPSVYAANTSVIEYLVIDPLFDEVVGQKIKQLNSEGITGAKAKGLAEQYAMNLIEDQGDLDIEDVLANQVMLQKEYVDNAISVTINVNPSKYTPEDVQGILKHYLADLKGVTMFPESSFPQSPLERITYEKVLEMEMNGYPVERTDVELACFNGACPIK